MASADSGMKEVLSQKAHELFALCDREQKGFIGKRDMQRMIQELPLDPDQLEDVFDSLDIDGNGFLTLEEFTNGFGSFLGLDEESVDDGEDVERLQPSSEGHERQVWRHSSQEQRAREDEQDANERFADFVLHSGAGELLGESEAEIHQMWDRLQREAPDAGPALVDTFARLLGDISGRVRRCRTEQETLETALRQQQDTMQTQMKNMFEEMEAQIAAERNKNTKEEEQRQLKIREELESQVAIKELEAQMTRQQLADVTSQLQKLSSSDSQQRQENAQLQKQKDQFEEEVVRQKRLIAELQASVDQSRSLSLEERRKRALAAFSVTENIASEREDLVKQLDLLRSINTKLMDERDSGHRTSSVTKAEHGESLSESLSVEDRYREAEAHTAVSGLMSSGSNQAKSLQVPVNKADMQESDCEVDEVFFENNPDVVQRVPVMPLSAGFKGPLRLAGGNSSLMDELMEGEDVAKPLPVQRQRPNDAGSETDDQYLVDRHHKRARCHSDRHHSSTLLIYHQGQVPRVDPERPEALTNGTARQGSPTPSATSTIIQPQRVYKVVIIGDAGVGKSSFVQRFCTGEVRPSYAATIGVDFQVQTVVVDDQTVCIQLWDTAGQERFRSITKQYFRKADGVFVMFDVTTETVVPQLQGMDPERQGPGSGRDVSDPAGQQDGPVSGPGTARRQA
ncbi:ras and EF-hand domain-containing protein-like [Pollicipes pollicipes]|uniref:ras and EF-hand domain-containing protein-like n=1 Tax=Pollicipes pollicipes TaxID=41117 RepID=UPI001884C8F7|nr:ras and EF-hand domain-containing protein-like [Pollicipes pollicipes]